MAAGVLHPCASRRRCHSPDLETCKRCAAAAGARHPCGSRRPVALRERAPRTPAPAGALHPWHSRRATRLRRRAPAHARPRRAGRRSARGAAAARPRTRLSPQRPPTGCAACRVGRCARGPQRNSLSWEVPTSSRQWAQPGGRPTFRYVWSCTRSVSRAQGLTLEGLVGCLLAACGADARQLARTSPALAEG